MANTLNKSLIGLAYDVLNPPSGGARVDDSRISIRQVMWWIRTYYSALLSDELERKKQGLLGFSLEERIVTDLGCIPLTEVDPASCGCDYTICSVLATPPLPKFMSIFGKTLITFVGSIDKTTAFTKTTAENVRAASGGRFGSGVIYWYYKSDRIYVVIPKSRADMLLTCINIQGVTEDLAAVVIQCRQDGSTFEPCFDIWSTEVNIPDRFIPRIRQEIWTKEIKVLLGSPADPINDGAPQP